MNRIHHRAVGRRAVVTALAAQAIDPHGKALAEPAGPARPEPVVGYGIILPGLIEPDGSGPLMALIQAVWRAVPGWALRLEALPLYRVVAGVTSGHADFGFPELRLPGQVQGDTRYHWSREAMGRVSFVLYSAGATPLTRRRIEQAVVAGGRFPFGIEAPELSFGFPILRFSSLDNALRKVATRRIDGLLWAQEEADIRLRQLGLRNVHRAHFGDFEDVLMLHSGARRASVDQAWSQGLSVLRRSGDLAPM